MGSPLIHLGPIPVALKGSGVAFPALREDNATLLARLGAVPERRVAGVLAALDLDPGVRSRARAVHETPVDLACVAAADALVAAGLTVGDIGAHVHATSTPTRWTSAEAARIGQRLGLRAALCDVRSGCTAGLWALWTGASLARDSGAPVLVTAADVFGKVLPPDERVAAFAFGDAACALVLVPASSGGLVRAVFGGRPALVDLASVPVALPPTDAEPAWHLAGDPVAFAAAAEQGLSDAIVALDLEGPIVVQTARVPTALAVAGDRAWLDLLRAHGNLGAATPGVALHLGAGRPGTVVLASAGGGLSYGAVGWEWT